MKKLVFLTRKLLASCFLPFGKGAMFNSVGWSACASVIIRGVLAFMFIAVGELAFESSHAPVMAQEKTLYLYNWNNYISERNVADFEKACACRLSEDYYSDNDEMLAKLAAGATGYDIIVPTGNAVETLIRTGALKPLDKSKLPNLKNLNPAFLNKSFDPGNKYSIPYSITTTLLGYNETRLKALGLPTNTLGLLFNPKYLEKLKGRVTVLDSPRELLSAALVYLGYSANDLNPKHWEEAKNIILRAKPYWAAFNGASYIKELTLGNIWVAQGYSNDMYQAEEDAKHAHRPFKLGFSVPKEGGTMSIDSMVIHKSSPNPELAHVFINFMMDGREAADLSNFVGCGVPNRASIPFVRPDVAANTAIFPDDETLKRVEMLRDVNRKQRRLLNRIWTEIKVH